MQNLNLGHIYEIRFFGAVCTFGLKVCNKYYYDPKKYFLQIFSIWVSKRKLEG
jgi:hypothetical protein